MCNPLQSLIANTKKYLKFDWVRGVQYWPYLYSVFSICTLLLNKMPLTNLPDWSAVTEQAQSATTQNLFKLILSSPVINNDQTSPANNDHELDSNVKQEGRAYSRK